MARMDDLLLAAAKAFEEGYSPFSGEWLSEHNVTLDECETLSHNIALAITSWHDLRSQLRHGNDLQRLVALHRVGVAVSSDHWV